MTAATVSSVSAPVTDRAGVSFSNLLWVTWRQHRLAIVVTVICVAALSGLLYWDSTDVAHSNSATLLAMMVVPAAAGLIAMFWGAPLFAREYEDHTNLLVFSQDVSVTRWLLGKIAVLVPILIVLWAVLGTEDGILARRDWSHYPSIESTAYAPVTFIMSPFAPFGTVGFESWIPLQIAYVLFGFALGLLIGAIARRTTLAIGVTLAAFAAVRVLVTIVARPYFLTPIRYVGPLLASSGIIDAVSHQNPNTAVLQVNSGYLDGAGNSVSFPDTCYTGQSGENEAAVNACAQQHGVVHTLDDYQPVSRLTAFHFIELSGYLVLTAAVLIALGLLLRTRRNG